MVGFCPGEQPLWACFVTSPCTIPPEARCQADRGINAGGSAKTLDTYVTILLDKNSMTARRTERLKVTIKLPLMQE